MYKYTFALSCLALLHGAGAFAAALKTERVNVNPATGAQADGPSSSPAISADGCVVAFVSQSGTLANPGFGLTKDSPAQVYAYDRCVTPHTLELISVTNDGSAAADETCLAPNISADGRYVAFVTLSGNLPMPNSAPDNRGQFVFVRDRLLQTTSSPLEAWRVTAHVDASLSFSSGTSHRYMSADATRFAFEFTNSATVPYNLYVFDTSGGSTTLQPVCPAAAATAVEACGEAQMSADGSTVLLATSYPLVASDTDGFSDVYSYDVASATASVISVNLDGSQPNQTVDGFGDVGLSGNGHVVAFSSVDATNFPGNTSYTLLLKNLDTPSLKLIGAMPDGTPEFITAGIAAPQLSDDGSRVAFNSDNSALSPWLQYSVKDALLYDHATNALHGLCVASSGSYGTFGCDSVAISGDGHWAAMRSVSSNLVPDDSNTLPDIFVVAIDPAVDLVFASGFEL